MAEYWKKIGYTPKPHELSKSSLSSKKVLPEDKVSPPKVICVKHPETIVIEDDWEWERAIRKIFGRRATGCKSWVDQFCKV